MQDLKAESISEAVERVWSTMLGLHATTNELSVVNRLKPTMLTGCIQITGAWQGAVTLECSGGLARRVASIMFGEDVCEITADQVNDALGELTNIVGGHIKALLPEPSDLSMPAVTEGTDYFFSVPGSRQMAQMSFTCEGKPFQVTILENTR
jgi:chemotaxis protein CheX